MSTRSHPHTPPHVIRQDLIAVFLCALAVNALAARFITRPGYMDAYYYFGGALQLARGQGFTEPYVWNYLSQLAPALGEVWRGGPSHLYWMPLTSLVVAPFIALAGADSANAALFRAAQNPLIVSASLLPLLSYAIAVLTTGLRRHALAAAMLTVFSGYYVSFWSNTDSFALYGLTAGGALLVSALAAQHRSSRGCFAAGLCAGFAHLTRADGLFVFLVALWALRHASLHDAPPLTAPASRLTNLPITNYLSLTFGYLLIMFPWLIRNLIVVGAPLAPGGSRALWLTEYNDLFNYPADSLTLSRYLATGWGSILAGKGWALKTNLSRLIGEQGLVVASPFIVIGLWRLRRAPLYAPALIYFLLLFGLMTFVFTFPGPRGGLFHSGAALLPFFFPAAVVGLDASVEAGARFQQRAVRMLAARVSPGLSRLFPPWQPERSQPIFAALLLLFAMALTTFVFQARLVGPDWRNPRSAQVDQAYAEVGDWLAKAGDRQSVVAVNNPPSFYYFTGHPSIIVPNGGPEVLLRAMTDFGARWGVLDVNHPAGLASLYHLPASEPRLTLRAVFADDANEPVYLFELGPVP